MPATGLLKRDRLVIAGLLVAAAVGLYRYSEDEFDHAVAGATYDGEYHHGIIDILTDDPAAAATLKVFVTEAELQTATRSDDLSISASIDTDRESIRFAVLLEGDTKPTGIQQRSTSLISRGNSSQRATIYAYGTTGTEVSEVWYVDEAGTTTLGHDEPTDVVLVGSAYRGLGVSMDTPIELSISFETEGDFVHKTSTGFEFQLPTVGGSPYYDKRLRYRQSGRTVEAGAAALIEDTGWAPPMTSNAEAHLRGLLDNDKVDSTPPVSDPAGLEERSWRSTAPLRVTGVIERASLVQTSQQRQFRAGAAMGLSAALIIWGGELLVEAVLGAWRSLLQAWRSRRHSRPLMAYRDRQDPRTGPARPTDGGVDGGEST